MTRILALLGSLLLMTAPAAARPEYVIVLHGGAGVFEAKDFPDEKRAAYHAALRHALLAAESRLKAGGTAVDAVEAAIKPLEDSPLFNAGRGAALTHEGRAELDAAIMDGASLAAGAVAGVTTVRNPISLARAVMVDGRHVMMQGAGADAFAAAQKLDLVPNDYFITPERVKQLEEAQSEKAAFKIDKYGTVGVVVLDRSGNLAAGTSTGGIANKRFGRVGDSPIIGAGTYADNASCGVSATGSGEYFIRATAARSVCARMAFGRQGVKDAAEATIAHIGSIGGDGGLIALDAEGNHAFAMNTPGMYRGVLVAGQSPQTFIFKDDAPTTK